jgi:hypothetical protein
MIPPECFIICPFCRQEIFNGYCEDCNDNATYREQYPYHLYCCGLICKNQQTYTITELQLTIYIESGTSTDIYSADYLCQDAQLLHSLDFPLYLTPTNLPDIKEQLQLIKAFF